MTKRRRNSGMFGSMVAGLFDMGEALVTIPFSMARAAAVEGGQAMDRITGNDNDQDDEEHDDDEE